jgi:acyl-CoA synthetase (AMP-forming)/AMP-acid ligase II
MDICNSVRRLARDQPDRPFCHVLWENRSQSIGYLDLLNAARRYAAVYLNNGVRAGDVVLIVLRHSPGLFPAFLGALLMGALPSFLPFLTPKQDPALYWPAQAALFTRIGARLLVTWGDNLASMRRSMPGFSIPVHLAEDTPREGDAPEIAERDYRGPAFLQHGSGTTGLQKGVVITHEALAAQVGAYAESIGFGQADTIATWLPVYHDMGLIACFLMPAMLGATVAAMDPFEWVIRPVSLLDAIDRYRCTFAWLPNFAFQHILALAPEDKRWDLSSIRALIDCSEPCRPETVRAFSARFGIALDKLQTCYALAENVFCATQSRLGEPVGVFHADGATPELLSCGRPIAGVQVRILDADGKDAPEGHCGEIALSGPCLFDGYHNNPEETRARLCDGWYRTRDLGFQRHGELWVTGRMDDLLIVHGCNYFAHDIEFAVNGVPGVVPGRSVALAEYCPDAGTAEAVVLVEADVRESGGGRELRRAIKRQVFSEMGLLVQEVGILPRGRLVKTTSGKISRVENLRLFRELAERKA